MKKIFYLLVFTLICDQAFCQVSINVSQIKKQLKEMEAMQQSCIDQGQNFIGCAQVFYNQMDSVLNVVYKHLKDQMSPAEFEQLKKEQKIWLKKRDKYAEKQKAEESENSDAGVDVSVSFAICQDAYFVEDRILKLLSRVK